jgi:hypothetical protein
LVKRRQAETDSPIDNGIAIRLVFVARLEGEELLIPGSLPRSVRPSCYQHQSASYSASDNREYTAHDGRLANGERIPAMADRGILTRFPLYRYGYGWGSVRRCSYARVGIKAIIISATEGKPLQGRVRVEKVHDRESLARPDPVIWLVESDRVEETGLRNGSDNSDGFTCGHEHRAGLEQTGELQTPGQTPTKSGRRDAVTPQGAVTARENVRRNRYRVNVCLQVVHRHKIRPESQAASAYSTTRVMNLGP